MTHRAAREALAAGGMTPMAYIKLHLNVGMQDWRSLSEEEQNELKSAAVREMKDKGIEVRS